MRYLITLLLAALSLNAFGQTNPNYNPDYDANGSISVNDLLGFLSIFGDTWDSGDVIMGCTYSNATDYNPLATIDDGSCTFLPDCAGDECGVCGGSGIADGACDCDGNVLDECGVCGGDNSTCLDCCGIPFGDGTTCDSSCGPCNDDTSCLDECGVPNGDNSCLDDCGVPNGDNSTCLDCCGVVNGDGSTCYGPCGACNDDTSCLDDCGVPNGDNSTCLDCCGVVNGDGSTCDGSCGACNDNTSCLDDCGVPNGDNSTCFTSCGDFVSHDGYDYSTVQIGDQCWFSENCRYLPSVSPYYSSSTTIPSYYVYGYGGSDANVANAMSQANYNTYGVLYNWPAVMEPGICPSGWHIPSDIEWQTMEMALGMSASEASNTGWRGTDQGSQMKSTTGWNQLNGSGNGTNSSGFTGLPGGIRTSGVVPNFINIGYWGKWWSASESGSNSWPRLLVSENSYVLRVYDSRASGFSARCVRDDTDECGVLGGDNSTCLDECGVPNGDNSTCLDYCGVVNGDNSTCLDECGVANGDNSTCLDECGVVNGDNSTCLDECGVPNGDNSTCFTGCGDGIMHDGHDYSTVQIGVQCWFSENCRYLPSVSPSNEGSDTAPYYYVYGYQGTDVTTAQATSNYSTYGVLYNWTATITEGICPSGWHVPSDGEFTFLTDYLGGEFVAGDAMKSTSGWSENGNGSNSSGFTGLPGGNCDNDGNFFSINDEGYFYSSSAYGGSRAWSRLLNDNDSNVESINNKRRYGMSVRCLLDYTDECGVPNGDNSCLDDCGVPNGDNSTCLDECGVLNGDNSCLDECGVPNGDNSTCLDDCGVPNGDNSTCLDCCGVVNGDGSTCYGPCGACNDDTSCLDDCGVPNGDNSTCLDCCGVVNGDGSTCDGSCGACNDNTSCLDDCGVPNGDNSTCLDDCGVPNGDNSTCFAGCGDGIMHDGHDYSTVQIGDHCWFSENCRYLPSVSPSSSSSTTIPSYYVFGYEGSDVAIAKSLNDYSVYGALYNWPAVMEPGICPSGWHIPSDLDWQIMEISLGMSAADAASYGERGSPVGNYLKSTWSWYGGGNGTNSSGFNGLAVGFTEAYQNTSGFYDYGYGGYWWSSSASGSSYAYYRTLYDGYDSVGRYNYNTNRGMSARCVQD